MAIVIEILNRAGHVINTYKFAGDKVVIGRGLNADLTLHDPHLDARHCAIELAPDSHNLYCEDAKSLNGVFLLNSKKQGYGITFKNKTRLSKRQLFYSGQQFLLGRTVIRVYHADHPVVAPLPLSRWEEIGHYLSHWSVWLPVMCGIVVLQSLDSYLNNPTRENILQYILPSGYALLGALTFAGIWAFVGRNLRHEGRFSTLFSVALLTLLLAAVLDWLLPIFVYNSGLWWAQSAIDTLLGAGLAFAAGLLTLLYATHLKLLPRVLVALIIPTVLVLSLVIGAITKPEFRSSPAYETALVAPHWQVRSGIEEGQFLTEVQSLVRDVKDDIHSDDQEENRP